jgi:Spb1 C-terminal domain
MLFMKRKYVILMKKLFFRMYKSSGNKKEEVTYVRSKRFSASKNTKRPAGVKGRYKVVDPRMRKDTRGMLRAKGLVKGKGGKGGGKGGKAGGRGSKGKAGGGKGGGKSGGHKTGRGGGKRK